ncbi:two-component system regulatory protein YycI [Halobacillus mangrovi]|uniref:Regulatory protein YycH-like domain-containing protein n=1 Tax=Halobacillus mangrovi TaxID=402384 RepID=A0A1W5ZQJ4_9BACI|nr:two-component system regulatory protein YycI [Halobacillus mangrovi]ARI75565.1 hypothetical protein HM131_01435 [Halobacillus mangrovi]
MQWGQIKLLFILSFLILDLFLLQQFLSKQEQTELPQSTTTGNTVQQELENNNITLSEEIPPEVPMVPNVTSTQSEFSEEVLSDIEALEEEGSQQINFVRDNVLKATLKEPVEFTEDNVIEKVGEFVPFSNQYSYWGWNKEQNVLLFFQKTNDRTVYFNRSGFLMVKVEDGKMTEYVATLLSFEDEEVEKETSLISPMTTVKRLLDEGKIETGDEITSMNIGYLNGITLSPGEENGPQVFGPTWKVTVNGEENHFVYAIDGKIFPVDEENFIQTAKESYEMTDSAEPPSESESENSEESSGETN